MLRRLTAALALMLISAPAIAQYSPGKAVSDTNPLPVRVASGGGGGSGGAVTAVSGAYAAGSIVDIGTGGSPGANTVNGRLVSIGTQLGTISTQLPAALGATTSSASLPVALATDGPVGAKTDAAATTTDTTSTSLIAQTKQLVVRVNALITALGSNPAQKCVYNSTLPTLTTGTTNDCLLDTKGSIAVLPKFGIVSGSDGVSNSSIASATGTTQANNSGSPSPLATAPWLYTPGGTWQRQPGDTFGAYSILTPGSASQNAIVPVVGSGVASVAGKVTAGNLYSVEITTGGSGVYLYVFNATALPSDGAVTAGTASGNYQFCRYIAATTSAAFSYDIPERYSVGIRPAVSSTACGTLTAATSAVFLKSRAQ